jgi:peptidoglycan/xylan/chitin deacetylase (PgdA/CDA1 family)
MTPPAALSVDLELFDQTPACRSAAGTAAGDVGLEGCRFLREAFERHGATATCFVVSAAAERHPDAVRAFADEGHEIGSHTHTHRLLSDLDAAGQREEMAASKRRLEALTGASVDGFRAPAFDLAADHFGLLAEVGYTYDSSVVAARSIPGWYGGEYDMTEPGPATRVDPDAPESVREVPVSVMPRLRLPLTGTWLRFFGPRYTLYGMRRLAARGIAPVLYVHPWEFVDLPDVEGVPTRVYWHTGEWMRRAVERILAADFSFTTVRALAEA